MRTSKQSIAIGVGGRFHADHMAETFTQLGHQVGVYTTLPKFRFKDVKSDFQSFVLPEIVFRLGKRIGFEDIADMIKMRTFGEWWAYQLRKKNYDLLIGWSSFSLEAFERSRAKKWLMRDSMHIQSQYSILEEEYQKFKVPFPKRSFCVSRELEEYAIADRILVLSESAKKSFIEKGVPQSKLSVIRLGVDTSVFRAKNHLAIFNHPRPIKVVYFGSLLVRKGISYLLEATKNFNKNEVKLTLVGPVAEEIKGTLKKYTHFELRSPMPHAELSRFLQTQDVFVLPSIEDGFGMVVPQAMASGLVPIVTSRCGAADLIESGASGYVVPPCSPESITEKLTELLEQPNLLFRMKQESLKQSETLSWESCYKQSLKELFTPDKIAA